MVKKYDRDRFFCQIYYFNFFLNISVDFKEVQLFALHLVSVFESFSVHDYKIIETIIMMDITFSTITFNPLLYLFKIKLHQTHFFC